jgi:hypothetical protein
MSKMKTVVDPELAVAHLVFKVADLKSSCQFYSNLGLPPFYIEEKIAIIELRGGTHLVLLSVDEPVKENRAKPSVYRDAEAAYEYLVNTKGIDRNDHALAVDVRNLQVGQRFRYNPKTYQAVANFMR